MWNVEARTITLLDMRYRYNSTETNRLSYHIRTIGWQPTYRPLEGHYQPTQNKQTVGIRSSKVTNTNRLAQEEPTLIKGAITSTATAFILLIGTLVPSTAFAGAVSASPTREHILTALRLMSNDYEEYLCNAYIIKKESNYRTDARNGSHYGLPQGRSRYLATATYTQQLAWYKRYIQSRYDGDGCKAKAHHEKHNWY